jgi:hypothetical protein
VQRFNRTIREESNESTMQGIGEELLKIAGVDGFPGFIKNLEREKGCKMERKKSKGMQIDVKRVVFHANRGSREVFFL